VGVVVGVLSSSPCFAQGVDDATRRAARELGASGVEAFQEGQFVKASDKLDRAYRVLKVPSLGLWSARALAKINKLVEAAERYAEVTRLGASSGDEQVQRQAKHDAEIELAQLSPQIPNIVVTVKGADADATSVQIDGATMSSALIGENRPVNPGRHTVQGSSASKSVKVTVEVALGETKPALLDLASAPSNATAPVGAAAPVPVAQPVTVDTTSPAPSDRAAGGSSRRTLGFVALGVGGAGLVLGGVAGALALGKKGDIDDSPNCRENQCLPSEQDTVDGYRTWRTVSSIGLIGGAVLAAAGATLVLTAPSGVPATAIRITPGAVTVSRAF
jgi:hypothetical protein